MLLMCFCLSYRTDSKTALAFEHEFGFSIKLLFISPGLLYFPNFIDEKKCFLAGFSATSSTCLTKASSRSMR